MQDVERVSPAADAFGVPPPPWYKGTPSGTPRALAGVVGVASTALAGLAASDAHGLLRILVWLIIVAVPPGLLAGYYRGLRRRRAEAVLPAGEDDPPKWLPRALRPRED